MTETTPPVLPRLVAYTREDKAAKGLRSLRAPRTAPEPPIHFTALEMIQEERALLLTAPPGGGRSTLARRIERRLSGERAAHAKDGAPVRNDLGDEAPEASRLGPTLAAVVAARPGLQLSDALAEAGDGFATALSAGNAGSVALLILDDAQSLGDGWRDFAAPIPDTLAAFPRLRLLLLGEARVAGAWSLPPGMVRHALLPLPRAQRQRVLAAFGSTREDDATLTPAAAHPGIFALARQVGAIGAQATPEAIVDAWLRAASPEARAAVRTRAWLAALLDAADLAEATDPRAAVARFAADPEAAAPVIASLLARWRAPRRAVHRRGCARRRAPARAPSAPG